MCRRAAVQVCVLVYARVLDMLYSFQRNVAALGGHIVIAHRAHFAVRTNQILPVLERVREADVLEREHVIHLPVVRQRLRFGVGLRRFALLVHQRQAELRNNTNKNVIVMLVAFHCRVRSSQINLIHMCPIHLTIVVSIILFNNRLYTIMYNFRW